MKRTIYDQENQCLREMSDDEVMLQKVRAMLASGEKQNGNAANKMQMSDDEVMLSKIRKIVDNKPNDKKKVDSKGQRATEVEKNQIRRSTFLGDDYYLVLYAEHKVSGHNYCIVLSEDGTIYKVPTITVNTWELMTYGENQAESFWKTVVMHL